MAPEPDPQTRAEIAMHVRSPMDFTKADTMRGEASYVEVSVFLRHPLSMHTQAPLHLRWRRPALGEVQDRTRGILQHTAVLTHSAMRPSEHQNTARSKKIRILQNNSEYIVYER